MIQFLFASLRMYMCARWCMCACAFLCVCVYTEVCVYLLYMCAQLSLGECVSNVCACMCVWMWMWSGPVIFQAAKRKPTSTAIYHTLGIDWPSAGRNGMARLASPLLTLPHPSSGLPAFSPPVIFLNLYKPHFGSFGLHQQLTVFTVNFYFVKIASLLGQHHNRHDWLQGLNSKCHKLSYIQ